MNNSKFWGAGTDLNTGSNGKSVNFNNKAVAKKLGITGIVVLAVVAIVGLVFYLFVGRPALALISVGNVLKADKNQIMEALKNRDLVALDKTLNKTEADLNNVKKERDSKFGWARNLSLLKINEFYSDSDRFINAGLYLIDAMREMEKIVTPFADAAGLKVTEEQQVTESKGLMEAFQSWVSLMPEVAGQMDGVIERIAKVGDVLTPINVEKYPVKIRGVEIRSNIAFIKNTLSKADDYAPDLKQALTIFPRVLAVGTPTKRYMIIMQNDKELRPTGGFMTNYATFKIQNALLQSDFTSKDMYSIDLALEPLDRAGYDFPDAPAPYMKYLKVEHWFARDMNYSPDFVTSMDQFLKFYNMAGRYDPVEIKAVDGIIAIDTEVVKELLGITGPVTLNGVTYTAENVVLELETIASLELREQSNRKGVLGKLMQQMLINVFESDKDLWSKLIEKGITLAMEKHIQAYLFDPEAQALVEKYNLAGRIVESAPGDYSMIVSTNLGGDKTNWFVSKEVEETVVKDDPRWIKTVKIKYTYPQPGPEFGPFVKGFKDWVRVYAPAGAEFISVDGSEDGTSTEQERGKIWFSGYVELTPGQTKELTFKYYLPGNIATDDLYNLTLQKQAGVGDENYKITFNGKSKTLKLSSDTQVSIKP